MPFSMSVEVGKKEDSFFWKGLGEKGGGLNGTAPDALKMVSSLSKRSCAKSMGEDRDKGTLCLASALSLLTGLLMLFLSKYASRWYMMMSKS